MTLSKTSTKQKPGKRKRWKPCGEGVNICNCKKASECGYIEIYAGIARLERGENIFEKF